MSLLDFFHVILRSRGCSPSSLVVGLDRFNDLSSEFLDKSVGYLLFSGVLERISVFSVFTVTVVGLAGDGPKCASSAVGGLILRFTDGTLGGVTRSPQGDILSVLGALIFFGEGNSGKSSVLNLGNWLKSSGLINPEGGPEGWKI